MANVVNLIEGNGFEAEISLAITNAQYFNIDKQNFVFLTKNGVSYEIISGDADLPISKTESIKFRLSKFDTREEAVQYTEHFIANLRLYLSKHRFNYEKISYWIKDLAKVEIAMGIHASMELTLLKPFAFQELLANTRNEKIAKALSLLELANRINDTMLELVLYIVVLESLTDDSKRHDDSIDYIDKIISEAKRLRLDDAEDKNSIISVIGGLKKVGAKKSVLNIFTSFSMINDEYKIDGKSMTCKRIFSACYDLRSQYVHDGLFSQDAIAIIAPLREITYLAMSNYSKLVQEKSA